ncbi:class I adenylate-forming enzyme family protein [Palleronia caenipelagi]|uniref:Acyl--CoA ligase n=1 Tax=Palleronia caenipelagi TaxID=2489174 RepID=A0A547Q5Z3_9RHOB|nr:class I adenylate-forming enzyme family protein [Palleronia caenipelagi]TRD21792.1 acyl--CoA ligase [Palleronia caenipelagi]
MTDPAPALWPDAPSPFNMARHVLAPDGADSGAVALVSGGEVWRRHDLTRAALGVARGFLNAGAVPGDRVLLRLGNSVDFPLAFLGAQAAGLVPVATSAALTRSEITPMAGLVTPRFVVQDPEIAAPDLTELPVIPVETLREWRDLPTAGWHMGDPNRPGYVVFTSGSEALPRAVLHAHRAVWARGMGIRDWIGLTPADRVLHAGAMNWTYTFGVGLCDPWSLGATAIVPPPGTSPDALPDLLAHHEVTIFAAVPGVFRRMLKGDLPPLPHLRHALSAGEKLPEAIREEWRARTGTEIFEAYGQSECSTFLSSGPGHSAPEGCLGRPQTGRRVAILGPDGAPVPPGTHGAIAVHRNDPGLMLRYLCREDDMIRGNWRLTGDTGAMDDDGWVTYHGRSDDVITAGGYRLSPLEIEAVALGIEGVEAAAAYGREVRPGVTVVALAYAGQPGLEAAIGDLCQLRLAGYKCPRQIDWHADLPVNANGKIRRAALRKEM